MIRFGCDSASLGALLPTDFVMPYADLIGTSQELAALRARFPRSELVFFDRGLGDPLGLATIIDVERGARLPRDCPDWFDERHAAGHKYLTVYASYARMPAVDQHMAGRGFWRFFAYWGNGLVVPGHPDAMIQFASGAMLGAKVDLTLVHNDAWHPRTPQAAP
jgi:hypothetical protein